MKLRTALQTIAIITLILNLAACNRSNRDYYWRDYNWTIPSDAVPGGKDSKGQQTYIGQAYMHDDGIFVVQIFPEAKEIFASSYGLKKATKVVKILCSRNRHKFSWLQTSSKYFHQNVTGENPIVGGFNHREPHKGMVHVGRLVHHVVVRLGSIDGFLENAKMNYVHGSTLQTADDFEVLVYNH